MRHPTVLPSVPNKGKPGLPNIPWDEGKKSAKIVGVDPGEVDRYPQEEATANH